jgi:hypothetical protein
MGGIASVKRDEALWLEPKGLGNLETTVAASTHIARRDEHKTNCTKSVDATGKASRAYTNVGHIKEAIAGLCRLVKYRHKQGRATGADAIDLFRVHLALEVHARTLDAEFVPEADGFAERYLRLSEADRAAIRQEVADHPPALNPVDVGDILRLTDKERSDVAVRFRRAEANDLSPADREVKRKAADAARNRENRRKKGATPRSQCRARKRELHPDLSQATFYRRLEAEL